MPKPGWLASEWYSLTEKWRLSGPALSEALDKFLAANTEVTGRLVKAAKIQQN